MTICILLISIRSFAPAERCIYVEELTPVNPYTNVWKAVCQVESGNNPMAYNASENAFGIAQIRDIRLKDYNYRFNKKVPQIALFDVETSRTIFMSYVSQYSPDDIKGIAICWNGISKENKYYKKLKKQLAK